MTDVRIRDHSLLDRLRRLRYRAPGRVAFLVEKPAPGVHELRDRVSVIAGRGFGGDHSRVSWWKGRLVPGREVTAVALEVLGAMQVAPDVPGDNLVTAGLDLAALRPGDRLGVGGIVLVRGPEPHRPCATFRHRAGGEAFEAAAAGYRGALFRVEVGGVLTVGDPIRIHR